MAAGASMGLPLDQQGGRLAGGDQRSLGRAAFARHMRSGAPIQDDEVEMLKYFADVGRGVPPKPRATGFAGVVRR